MIKSDASSTKVTHIPECPDYPLKWIVSQSVSQSGVYYSHTYSNQTYGIATLMSKDPYTVGMHRVLSTHYTYKCGDAKSMW